MASANKDTSDACVLVGISLTGRQVSVSFLLPGKVRPRPCWPVICNLLELVDLDLIPYRISSRLLSRHGQGLTTLRASRFLCKPALFLGSQLRGLWD
jgi:hypothetical protein